MGESGELQPLAIIEDVPFMEFVDANPTEDELKNFYLNKDIDLYEQVLTNFQSSKDS